MKVLLLNGSPRAGGNTALAIQEMIKVFHEEGIETTVVSVGNKDIRGCIACGACRKTGKCVFDDLVNETAPLFAEADGLVLASPVYYASANATLIAFVTRLFQSTGATIPKAFKVGASVAVARRGGITATYDQLNKFFAIAGMPIASGQYWNGVHGMLPGEAEQDGEGLQQMRTLARNMAWLIKAIAARKEAVGLPAKEPHVWTNFVR